MKQTYKTSLAFVAASVVPAIYLALVYPLSGERDVRSVVATFVIFYYFSAAATALLGLPVFLLLHKFKLIACWSSVCSGALVGVAAYFAVESSGGGGGDIESFLSFVILGVIAGLAFWSIWHTWLPMSRHKVQDAA